jgi:hypothetical protein
VTGQRTRRLRARLSAALADRLSPERIRRATMIERLTVRRLPWGWLERLNRYGALLGKIATVVWVGFCASIVLGVSWKDVVEAAVNSGRPVKGAVALAFIVPTLVFVALRSGLGYCRWRIQRELWRRDVERLSSQGPARAPAARAAPSSAPAEALPPRAPRP